MIIFKDVSLHHDKDLRGTVTAPINLRHKVDTSHVGIYTSISSLTRRNRNADLLTLLLDERSRYGGSILFQNSFTSSTISSNCHMSTVVYMYITNG